jgi:hypothetical protein
MVLNKYYTCLHNRLRLYKKLAYYLHDKTSIKRNGKRIHFIGVFIKWYKNKNLKVVHYVKYAGTTATDMRDTGQSHWHGNVLMLYFIYFDRVM